MAGRVNKIVINASQCLICGDILVSKNRHDFVACSCENLSVDGGTDYLKRNVFKGKIGEKYTYRDLSLYSFNLLKKGKKNGRKVNSR